MLNNLLKWIRGNGIIIPLFFLIYLFGFSVPIRANNYSDSLLILLSKAKEDTTIVNLLYQISDFYPSTQHEKAISFGKQSLKLAEELDYNYGKLNATKKLGKIYKQLGAFDSALYYVDQAIKVTELLDDQITQTKNYNDYGSLLRRIGYYSSAMEYHQKSLELSKQLDYPKGIADAYVYIGIINEFQLDYDSAINNYYKSVRIYEQLVRPNSIGIALLNIGDMYENLRDYNKSLQNFKRGLALFEQQNDTWNIGLANNKIGIIYSQLGKYDSAMYYYNICNIYYDSAHNLSGLGHLDINKGNVYMKWKMYDSAYFHFNRATNSFKQMDFKRGYLNSLLALAYYYSEKNQEKKALEIYDECWDFATLVDPQALRDIYLNILSIHEKAGDYKKAFEYQSKYLDIRDSIFKIDKAKIIADVELKYEKEKDQAKILALENENLSKDLTLRKRTNQRNIYLFSGAGVISIILFLLIFYQHKAKKDKIIADQKIKQLEEEKKLLAAKFIVEGQEQERKRIAKELHDGLGVLLSTTKIQFTSIKDKSPENNIIIDKATKLLEQATGEVRKISHNMMPGLLTRFGLFEAAEELIDQVDESEGLSATCEITGDTKRLPENTEIMLYRVIQEMVNNTLKHAEATIISLKIEVHSELININYRDNGRGFNVEEKMKLKSIGLNSIQSRVNFLNGIVTIKSELGQGVNYTIHTPTV